MKITLKSKIAERTIVSNNEIILKEFVTNELPKIAEDFMSTYNIEKCECIIEGELELKDPPMGMGTLFG